MSRALSNAQIFLTCAVLMLTMTGCGQARATFQLQSLAPLNVNDQNESTPVDVRFYQLKSDAKFRSATVDALWTDDRKVLGDDLLAPPATTTVFPAAAGDAPVSFPLDLGSGTAFIGVLALFHRADAEDHRMIVLPLASADRSILLFTGFAVTLKDPHDPPAPAKDR